MTSPVLRRERGSNAPYLSGAFELGISQQTISRIEQSAEVEEDVLNKIANILGVTPESIKNFTEEAVFNIISNTYHNTSSDNSTLIASSLNYQPTFNTIEKFNLNPIEKIVTLYDEKVALLERLLVREKVELLRRAKH